MATADRILDLIDAGLAEAGTPTAPAYGRTGACGRCGAPADEEVCAGCRAFLLGDSAADPVAERLAASVTTTDRIMSEVLRGAIDELAEAVFPAIQAAAESFTEVIDAQHGDLLCQCPACWCRICGARFDVDPVAARLHECDLTDRAQPMGFLGMSPIAAERARITALNEPAVPPLDDAWRMRMEMRVAQVFDWESADTFTIRWSYD